jgi:octaprenyl-diphosphate synthase
MTLNEITKPIKQELDEFNKFFKKSLKTDVPLLNLIIRYLTYKKGKQVRPALVMLSAALCGGINERTFVGAALVELLHTATLIHDDVVDDADERRGLASINKKWNNKIAVLVGDYLLSKGLLSAIDHQEYVFLDIISRAVRQMSEGELLGIEKSRTLRVSEDDYFKIINAKTASLLSVCCEIGAFSTSSDLHYRNLLRDFGTYCGLAFQIRDDIFDYTSSQNEIGKPVGNDLREKKITLPLIYALQKNQPSEAKKITKQIKNGKLSDKQIADLANMVISTGGIDYAKNLANDYVLKAKQCLQDFPASDAKTSLINFADFVVSRDF